MKHVIGRVDEFPVGEHRIITVARRSIGVFRTRERFYALRNRCPHQGGPLCEGLVQPWVESPEPGVMRLSEDRWRVACPWHNWEYDLETGESWFDPRNNRVKAYPVSVESGDELVRGPYTAETFPIEVQGDHVVLDMTGGAP
jgi:nitrite reductase/ring-hydroxylating ferredoxin subunit